MEIEGFLVLVGVVCCKIWGAEASECLRLFELEVLASSVVGGFKAKSTCRAEDERKRVDFNSVTEREDGRFTVEVATLFIGKVTGLTLLH